MTLEELVKLEKHEVRNSNSLMLFYVEQFKEIFGREPNCAGCTFNTDFSRLKKEVNSNKTITPMSTNKTFELSRKESNTIFTYLENGRPIRTYGYKMTEEFALKYLSTGSKKELEERKKSFTKLPNTEEKELSIDLGDGSLVRLKDATGKELDAYAKEKGIDLGDATKVKDKKQVISKTL